MKVAVDKKKFQTALELGSRFVAKNSTLPILANVALIAEIDKLVIKGTDMNKYIDIKFDANVEIEGAVTVNAKILLDAVRNLDEESVMLEVKNDGSLLVLKSGVDKLEFVGIPISEYVAVPDVEELKSFFLNSNILSKGIQKTESSIPEKSFNTIITGMLIKSTKEWLAFVGTDSYRLAEYRTKLSLDEEFSIVIPKHVLSDIKKISDLTIGTEYEDIKVVTNEKLVAFFFNTEDFKIQVKSSLISGTYPDYESIILPSYNAKLIVDKYLLEKAIKKVSLFSKDLSYMVKFIPEEEQLIVSSGETDLGEGVTKIPAIYEGEKFSIGLNGKYLLDFLKNVEGEEVIFNIFDAEKPILIEDKGDEGFRFIIIPLKE